MTSSPSLFITPWMVGPSEIVSIGFFEDPLVVTNPIGPEADSVELLLFEDDCETEIVGDDSSAVYVSGITLEGGASSYSVTFDTGNFATNEGIVEFSGDGGSTGIVKFCTRVTSYEEELKASFFESVFKLNFDMTDNEFELLGVGIEENEKDEIVTDLQSEFTVNACNGCEDFICSLDAQLVNQNEALTFCIYPSHSDMTVSATVEISNFDAIISAGDPEENNYVEFVSVSMGSTAWESSPITTVSENYFTTGHIVSVSTPLLAEFFTSDFTQVNVNGNAFLEFIVAKAGRNELVSWGMVQPIATGVTSGCIENLIKKVQDFF
jgi:hypothetical protein